MEDPNRCLERTILHVRTPTDASLRSPLKEIASGPFISLVYKKAQVFVRTGDSLFSLVSGGPFGPGCVPFWCEGRPGGIQGVVFPSVVKEDLVGIQGVVVPFV
ncbi:hypothetical protein Taro_012501 [Colocasia esculenta]|uniref:Uncharacterized protein n=1 Tax=Colocasia esculenta TaxID=4460 RepID=A0A843U997_COLES|nr:hypothetical protein [Colocasia esculenta]